MKHYLCHLETGRDFVITAEDDIDAAYTCDDYAACMYIDENNLGSWHNVSSPNDTLNLLSKI